jgi:multimeric flavodoxin WrbA
MEDFMKIAVLHGQNHKGSTYHITQMFLEEFKGASTQIEEFYFTNNSACIGCFNCIIKGEEKCPHLSQNEKIITAIEKADFIIIESPCYCMGMSGQLKIFMDHFAYRWMSHRPNGKMFSKVGLTISTTAGAGSQKVTKDLKQQMFYWGIPSIYRYPIIIGASKWEAVSIEKRAKIQQKVKQISNQIKRKMDHPTVSIKTKAMFFLMRLSQKSNTWSQTDKTYWEEQGWLEGKRPWKV